MEETELRSGAGDELEPFTQNSNHEREEQNLDAVISVQSPVLNTAGLTCARPPGKKERAELIHGGPSVEVTRMTEASGSVTDGKQASCCRTSEIQP